MGVVRGVDPVVDVTVPFPAPVPVSEQDGEQDRAQLHESMAALLASRGQWRQAYLHLRRTLEMHRAGTLELRRERHGAQEPLDHLRRELDTLRREHAEAREQSLRDSLTASYNRRYLDQRLQDLMAGTPLAVALVDLDFFKQINDTHGHLLGDRVLQRAVAVLQDGLPDGAFCARFGGDEFVLVLPEVGPGAAVAISEAARDRIERHPWATLAAGLRVTVSIGISHSSGPAPADRDEPISELLLSADQLLYQAKQLGRNAVAFRTGDTATLAGEAGKRRGGRG
ncbi:MAG TPA: GGDEF domain-containing protein [Pseudonocardiaceae bacterium]